MGAVPSVEEIENVPDLLFLDRGVAFIKAYTSDPVKCEKYCKLYR